jgi:hypothetical protein
MMAAMLRPRRVLGGALAALVALAVALIALPPAHAGKPKRYHFTLVEVKAAAGVSVDPTAVAAVKAQAEKVLATHTQLVATLAGAPPLDAGVPVWRKYLAKQKLAGAYRVNLEITGYEETVEDLDPGDKVELRLTIRLSLRMFGEVIPARTIAFTGDGGSTVKADVGRKLRPKHRDFNLGNAIEVAVDDALATSLRKLESTPPAKK